MRAGVHRTGVSRVPWGRTTWLVPLLLFAAVLLVAGLAFNLAHLDTGGESLPGAAPNPAPAPGPQGVIGLDAFTTAMLLLLVFGLVLVGALIALRRKPIVRGTREVSRWDYLGTLISLGLTLLVLLAWPRMTRASPASNATAGNGTSSLMTPVTPMLAGIPAGVFLAAAIFAALLVIAMVVRSHATLRPPHRPTTPPRREAIVVVDDALQDLRLGSEVRQVILECFRRFCALLGRRGIPDQDNLTPRELEGLAVSRLQVPAEAAASLTFLFEEARYSEHALGEADRRRAVESLETLRAALEA
jgi:Domain of unknown function (DUF4129)